MNRCYRLAAASLALLALTSVAAADPAHQEDTGKEWSAAPVTNADVPEVEPNNSLATAQFLGCGNTLRPASIAVATPRDTDYVAFFANAGSSITIGTDADGAGGVGDTRIRLFNNSGVVLASDDDAGPGLYSLISGFVAPYTGTYYVGIAAFSTQTGTYKAFITCLDPCPPPAPNDVCAGATPLGCGPIQLAGDTRCYTNNYTPLVTGTGGCTGFIAAGRDVVYRIEANAGDNLDVVFTSTADGSIYIVTDCNSPTTTCVAGQDSTLSNQPEALVHTFAAAGTYYLILDSFGTNTSGTWTLNGVLTCPVVSNRRITWGSLKQIYR